MIQYIDRDILWINPDCGLKTRQWKEVEGALKNTVEAARWCDSDDDVWMIEIFTNHRETIRRAREEYAKQS